MNSFDPVRWLFAWLLDFKLLHGTVPSRDKLMGDESGVSGCLCKRFVGSEAQDGCYGEG